MGDINKKHLDGEGLDYLIEKLDARYAQETVEIPTKTSDLINDSGFISAISPATLTEIGGIKPDGSTTTIDSDGTLHAIGGGGSVADMSNYYTKSQVDNKISDLDIPEVLGYSGHTGGDYDKVPTIGKVAQFIDDVYQNVNPRIPTKTSDLTNDSGYITNLPTHRHNYSDIDSIPKGSTSIAGVVKVDGTTITADSDGTIHSVGGGGSADLTNYYTKSEVDGKISKSSQYTGDNYNDSAASVGLVTAMIDEVVEELDIPTKTSDLTNDSGFITADDIEIPGVNVDDMPLRKIVNLPGNRIPATEVTSPRIRTFQGGTKIVFPVPVIVKAYKDNDSDLKIEKYETYSGNVITIPNTVDGYLRDYAIYNLLTSYIMDSPLGLTYYNHGSSNWDHTLYYYTDYTHEGGAWYYDVPEGYIFDNNSADQRAIQMAIKGKRLFISPSILTGMDAPNTYFDRMDNKFKYINIQSDSNSRWTAINLLPNTEYTIRSKSLSEFGVHYDDSRILTNWNTSDGARVHDIKGTPAVDQDHGGTSYTAFYEPSEDGILSFTTGGANYGDCRRVYLLGLKNFDDYEIILGEPYSDNYSISFTSTGALTETQDQTVSVLLPHPYAENIDYFRYSSDPIYHYYNLDQFITDDDIDILSYDGHVGGDYDKIPTQGQVSYMFDICYDNINQLYPRKDNLMEYLRYDSVPTEDSNNILTSGTIYDAVAPIQHTHDIDDVTDFDIESPLDGQVLRYDSTTGKWINSNGGSGGVPTDVYTKVRVGSTEIVADGADTITLAGGSNVTLSADTSTNTVTINASNNPSGQWIYWGVTGGTTAVSLPEEFNELFIVMKCNAWNNFVMTIPARTLVNDSAVTDIDVPGGEYYKDGSCTMNSATVVYADNISYLISKTRGKLSSYTHNEGNTTPQDLTQYALTYWYYR